MACALLLHIAFFSLILFKFAGKVPIQPAVVADAPVVSLAMSRSPNPSHAFRLADAAAVTQARPKALLPPTPQIAPPNPTVESLKLTPRSVVLEGPVLPPPQPSPSTPDLRGEPMPLHGETKPVVLAGSPPPANAAPDCHLAQLLQEKIQQNEILRGFVSQIPRQSRSVANAIMLWDGGWATPLPGDGQGALARVQTALRGVVEGSALTCRQQQVRGPQFITIVEASGTTVLVVGSGTWAWGDLLR